jgi:hypothetical protein
MKYTALTKFLRVNDVSYLNCQAYPDYLTMESNSFPISIHLHIVQYVLYFV